MNECAVMGGPFAGLSALVKAMHRYKGESARTRVHHDDCDSHWCRGYRYVGIEMWPYGEGCTLPRGAWAVGVAPGACLVTNTHVSRQGAVYGFPCW
jgi:hypothetical protein